MFSSIAVLLGQAGAPLYGAASSILDSYALCSSHECRYDACSTILWGPIGALGMRRNLYGSRDALTSPHVGDLSTSGAQARYISFVGRVNIRFEVAAHAQRIGMQQLRQCEHLM